MIDSPNNKDRPEAENDFELVRRCQKGDENAWESLLSQYGQMVINIAFSITGNALKAEEVCQDVFVKLVRRIDKFGFQSSFKTWLHRVAVNECLDYVKSKQRRTETSLELMPEETGFANASPPPSEKLERLETQAEVQALLEKMPEAFRVTLVLREMEEMSYEEIADVLGIPIGTVESRLYRAREMFRVLLGRHNTKKS